MEGKQMKIKGRIRDILRPYYYLVIKGKTRRQVKSTIEELKKYKGKYKGKRCFVIGNGPSLRIEDLDAIRVNEDLSFGCNRIYVLFDRTEWRPSFYINQDPRVIRGCISEIRAMDQRQIKFMKAMGKKEYEVDGAIYFDFVIRFGKKKLPKFSDNPEKELYNGYTVTYAAVQLAAYMGFKEIYLLGCDCSYSADNQSKQTISQESYPDERMYDPSKVGMPPDIAYMFSMYEVCKQYCEERGIKIYNATRGGKLEVFERVNFDSLMQK